MDWLIDRLSKNILFQEDAGVESDQVLREIIAAILDERQAVESPAQIYADIEPQEAKGESKKQLWKY